MKEKISVLMHKDLVIQMCTSKTVDNEEKNTCFQSNNLLKLPQLNFVIAAIISPLTVVCPPFPTPPFMSSVKLLDSLLNIFLGCALLILPSDGSPWLRTMRTNALFFNSGRNNSMHPILKPGIKTYLTLLPYVIAILIVHTGIWG